MTAPAVAGEVRVVCDADLDAVTALLATKPVESVFVASRIAAYGLDPFRLGCPVWGWFREGELKALCHAGSNLIPFGADDEALSAFAEQAGVRRRCTSIGGPSASVMPLWQELCTRGRDWRAVREVRARQPLMMIDRPSPVPADPQVQPIGRRDMDAYFDASVAMYTEEVGVSPFPHGSSRYYRGYVRELIRRGHSFGVVENGRVLFKADIGSLANGVAQIQGVWVAPDRRGRGLAPSAMAAVVALALEHAPSVSLYVNDFNTAALRTYQRVGFGQIGEFATILY
ncbi:GNAT family N-acetyltransferase [Naumannella halotolerans]|uniref:N-acetyltransferase domain-containing protein n=1 Tax=Naumannella halotolerans TaxID=993414 RepID=A0A4R7J6Q4_9ACTN|nr:GNAT family N-acetyltransferase [Naumannella halotolerans]TDT32905.1 hypothetical protein CLV29_0495 [Naumannella halotolerans]